MWLTWLSKRGQEQIRTTCTWPDCSGSILNVSVLLSAQPSRMTTKRQLADQFSLTLQVILIQQSWNLFLIIMSSLSGTIPIHLLNGDLLWYIINMNADMFDDRKALENTLSTSRLRRDWRNFMLSMTSLWEKLINFSSARTSIRPKSYAGAERHCYGSKHTGEETSI